MTRGFHSQLMITGFHSQPAIIGFHRQLKIPRCTVFLLLYELGWAGANLGGWADTRIRGGGPPPQIRCRKHQTDDAHLVNQQKLKYAWLVNHCPPNWPRYVRFGLFQVLPRLCVHRACTGHRTSGDWAASVNVGSLVVLSSVCVGVCLHCRAPRGSSGPG